MDRRLTRHACLQRATLLLLAFCLAQAGCANLLFTAAYYIKGTNEPAEFKELKGKKVAVVCRPFAELQYNAGNTATEIGNTVGMLLAQNVRKIKVIDAQRVAQWTDEHDWEDFTEVGRALGADMVVGIDLESFSLYQGQTLYQGRANVALTVFDMQSAGKPVFSKTMRQVVYPPNTGVPTSERQEPEFRRMFINHLSDLIGRHFYDHDTRIDVASDTRAVFD